MPETGENWPDLVNNYVYSGRQIRGIYQVMIHSVDLKAPLELWNRLSKTVLIKLSFIYNKQM